MAGVLCEGREPIHRGDECQRDQGNGNSKGPATGDLLGTPPGRWALGLWLRPPSLSGNLGRMWPWKRSVCGESGDSPLLGVYSVEVKLHHHSDDIWWYMMIYDDIWWYMMIYDDIWWYMMIYDDIWWYMMIYDDIWWYMMIYDIYIY